MKLNMISIGVSDETTDSIKTATKSHDNPLWRLLRAWDTERGLR